MALRSLIYADQTLETQFVLAAIWACLWFGLIKASAKFIFEPLVASMPWCEQWIRLNQKTFKTAYGVEFKTSKEMFEFGCLFLAIICQHAVGGALCIPSVLGWKGQVVNAMACHGALCEAGWELQDMIERIYQLIFGGAAGRAKNPTPLLVLLSVHHAMGLSMVIPMNIFYGSNPYYHEFVFLLQGAAFVALASQNYGFTLDVKTASGLKQMKMCVTITLLVTLWSRLLRYSFVGYTLICTYRADGNSVMLYMGSSVLALMGTLNALMVMDAIGKFSKFIKMKHTDDTEELEEALVHSSSSWDRHSTRVFLTDAERNWAKLRGAVRVGGLRATIVRNRNQ